jgi:hypothetical protein
MDTGAPLELALAKIVVRTRLAEMAVFEPSTEWTVLIGNHFVPVDVCAGADEHELVVSLLMSAAPMDSNIWYIHANGYPIQSVEGSIIKGRNCRLRLVYPLASVLAGV